MILYLDSSAIVKCYVQEQGSQETLGLIQVISLIPEYLCPTIIRESTP